MQYQAHLLDVEGFFGRFDKLIDLIAHPVVATNPSGSSSCIDVLQTKIDRAQAALTRVMLIWGRGIFHR